MDVHTSGVERSAIHCRQIARHAVGRSRGFTAPALLLFLIVGMLAWAVTLDQVQNTAVQARVSEAEATAATIMQVLQSHCARSSAPLAQQPYQHVEAPDSYIAELRIAGSCAVPELHIAMRHTDALPVEPVFAFVGQWSGDLLLWSCRETAGTGAGFVPDECR